MKCTPLGSTDILVSRIGLGTVKFGRNQGVKFPQPFALPTDQEILNLLSAAKSFGINLLDTAPAYGSSEERLGNLLKGSRHDWVISTKVGEEFVDGESHYDFSANAIQKSIERSLKLLNTDYLDIVLVHSNGCDEEIITEQNVFSVLGEFKRSGKIRAFGMSTKTIAGGKLTLDLADVVMVTYNPTETKDQEVIASAYKNQKGVFIKKALASGHLDKLPGSDPVKAAMEFVLREKGVTSVVLGTINLAHLQHIVQCVGDA